MNGVQVLKKFCTVLKTNKRGVEVMNTKAISRTIVVAILAVVIAVSAVAGGVLYYVSTTSSSKPTLTVAIWGGMYKDYTLASLEGFEEAYDCKLEFYEMTSSSELIAKCIAEASQPTLDVIMIGYQQAMMAYKAGIVEALDPSIVTNIADLAPTATIAVNGSTYFVGTDMAYMGIAVRTDKVNASEVTSWKWLWSSSLYPDKLGIPDVSRCGGGMVIQSSYIWFGDQSHNALNESWTKIKDLAPNIGVVWKDDAAACSALVDGTIDALVCWPPMAYSMIESGAPVKLIIPQEAAACVPDGVMVIKNGPAANTKLAMELTNWLISPASEIAWCTPLLVLPTNTKATMPDSLLPYMLSKDIINSLPATDPEYYSNNIDSWMQTWDAEIKPLL